MDRRANNGKTRRRPAPRWRHLAVFLLAQAGVLALLFATRWIPSLDASASRIELNGIAAQIALLLSKSGGKTGILILGLLVIGSLVVWPGRKMRQILREAAMAVGLLVLLLGGGSLWNEHFLKPALRVPRPNIVSLAQPPESRLGMTVEEFYDLPDKPTRSRHLAAVLKNYDHTLKLSPGVRRHWIAETGFSMPSGHSFASIFLAAFALGTGSFVLPGGRARDFYWLLAWAFFVCLSRLILRVHTSNDIVAGGLQGVVLGTMASLIYRHALEAMAKQHKNGDN